MSPHRVSRVSHRVAVLLRLLSRRTEIVSLLLQSIRHVPEPVGLLGVAHLFRRDRHPFQLVSDNSQLGRVSRDGVDHVRDLKTGLLEPVSQVIAQPEPVLVSDKVVVDLLAGRFGDIPELVERVRKVVDLLLRFL